MYGEAGGDGRCVGWGEAEEMGGVWRWGRGGAGGRLFHLSIEGIVVVAIRNGHHESTGLPPWPPAHHILWVR